MKKEYLIYKLSEEMKEATRVLFLFVPDKYFFYFL